VITGASSGIGLELAKLCVTGGFDLLIAADEPEIHDVALKLQTGDVTIDAVNVDLATTDGVKELVATTRGRPVDALLANAGRGLGNAFLDQSLEQIRRVIDTNVTGTVHLVHTLGIGMCLRRRGRILITGSIAGFVPGTYQAVYNGTAALLDSFAVALRHELEGSGVTVTCLLPGPTETRFFERAGLLDTRIGAERKQAASEVARIGFEAMMRGDGDVVAGVLHKLRVAFAHVLPNDLLARMHTRRAAPGTAHDAHWHERRAGVRTCTPAWVGAHVSKRMTHGPRDA
jgi:short-subunit dehydrogenase